LNFNKKSYTNLKTTSGWLEKQLQERSTALHLFKHLVRRHYM